MPRHARIVLPGIPHHVVQRGNRRQRTFFREDDYALYLRLAAETCAAAGVQVWAYCLMPNHVHLIVTPSVAGGLATAIGRTHLRYTNLINAREGWTGCLWQGRFGSFPMDDAHFRRCVRYVGLNPVRAGLVAQAVDWRWSSVRGHLNVAADALLTPGPVADLLADAGRDFFDSDLADADLHGFRLACRGGQPLGDDAWVRSMLS